MNGALLNRPPIAKKKNKGGYISGFSISSFLQVIELERKTCDLSLRTNGKEGCLFIRKGRIVNAQTGAIRGEKAAVKIIGWKNAQIKLDRPAKNIRQDIRLPLTRLILKSYRRQKSAPPKTISSEKLLTQAIRLAEGTHYKKAHTLLACYLKFNPNNSIAWLWYSRCLGNLQAISKALARCSQLTPKSLHVIEEIHKLKHAYQRFDDQRVRRCPFCWAPLTAKGEQCHFCKAGLTVSKAIEQKTVKQVNSKFLVDAVTRYTDVVARENNAKAVFYLSLANLNLNKAKEALDLLNEVSRINPDNHFLSDQLNMVIKHVAARLTDYTDSEEKAEAWAAPANWNEPAAEPRRKKILVVEDSPTTRKVIGLTLKQKGYAVVEARDGIDALGKVNEEQPDLVLLDIILPKMDGYRILSIIKKTPELKDTPVILLTSKNGMLNKVKGRLAGSTDYLTKPFVTNDLIEMVHKHIGS
jgi:twitching motility two-component system response regulator PilG